MIYTIILYFILYNNDVNNIIYSRIKETNI